MKLKSPAAFRHSPGRTNGKKVAKKDICDVRPVVQEIKMYLVRVKGRGMQLIYFELSAGQDGYSNPLYVDMNRIARPGDAPNDIQDKLCIVHKVSRRVSKFDNTYVVNANDDYPRAFYVQQFDSGVVEEYITDGEYHDFLRDKMTELQLVRKTGIVMLSL